MKITWIIPEPYGFLLDELEVLSGRLAGIRVLSGVRISSEVRERLPRVEFHDAPEDSFLPAAAACLSSRWLLEGHGALGIVRGGWHTRKISGIYRVLNRLENVEPSSVIHSHFAHPGGVGGSLVAGTPQIVTLRGYDILTTGSYGSLWNPFYRRNLVRAFGRGATVTAGSSYSFHRARQILGPDANVRLLYEAIVPESFVAANVHTRASIGLPADAVVLVAVGNLVEVKNHRMLVECLPLIIERATRSVHLLICGDGPLEGPLRAQVLELGLSDQVHFMGRLPRTELTDLYSLGDILVHTSLSEGFGNIILEAMLSRLLVVASPVGVAPDVIRHRENGYLPMLGVKTSLVESVLEAIDRFSAMDLVLESNREEVLAKYGMRSRIDSYLSLYQELANAQAAGSLS